MFDKLSEEKSSFLKNILDNYMSEFNSRKDKVIKSIYEDLVEETWYKDFAWYRDTREYALSEQIEEILSNDTMKDLLENICIEVWHGCRKTYDSIWSDGGYEIFSQNVLDYIGVDYASTYIEKYHYKEFEEYFKDELETYEVCDLLEGCVDGEDIYEDYVIYPERVLGEWLELETLDKEYLLSKYIKAEDLLNEDVLDELLNLKMNSRLKDSIVESIKGFLFDYLCKSICNYINSDLNSIKNENELNKAMYSYKKTETISRFFVKNEAFRAKLFENSDIKEQIKAVVYDKFTEGEMINGLSRLIFKFSNLAQKIFEESVCKEYLNISKEDVHKWLDEQIEFILNDNGLNGITSRASLYEAYSRGAKILEQNELYTVGKYNFADSFLEDKLDFIYSLSLESCMSKPVNRMSDKTYKNKMKKVDKTIKNVKKILEKDLLDNPNEVERRLTDLHKALEVLITGLRYKANNSSLRPTVEEVVKTIVNFEAYLLKGEYGENSHLFDYDKIAKYKPCLVATIEHDFKYVINVTYPTELAREELIKIVSKNPKEDFPLARSIKRKFVINVGETNTGKTYNALENLKEAKTGVYLAPLRLLALEVQEKLNNEGILCSLYTGEEEDCIEGAKHESLTVEKLNMSKKYDVCVIDECQMIGDNQRGYAWSNAILGVYADEIYLCVAPEALELVIGMIKDCGDDYEVVKHERKTPLVFENKPYRIPRMTVSLGDLRKGDALVVFSKRDVLSTSIYLKRLGISASVIYGALPYKSRKKQFEMFLNGETDVIVSTDAIGMGVNLPIRRIIFLKTMKYDGKEFRHLKHSEIKQIAGRAGRQGIYDCGYVNAVNDSYFIKSKLIEPTPLISKAVIMPSRNIVNLDKDLISTIKLWSEISFSSLYKKGDVSRYINLLSKLRKYEDVLTKEELFDLITLPFDEDDAEIYNLLESYLKCYLKKEINLIKPRLLDSTVLEDLEMYYKKLDLYYAFGNRFNMSIDLEWIKKEKDKTSESINKLIINNLDKLQKRCPQCGCKLPITWEHKLCQECFWENRRNEYNYDYDEW